MAEGLLLGLKRVDCLTVRRPLVNVRKRSALPPVRPGGAVTGSNVVVTDRQDSEDSFKEDFMTKILVTTDTSKLGHAALPHARAMAQALGAELVLLSVQPDPTAGIAGEFAYAPISVTAEEMLEEDRQLRESLDPVADGARIVVERAGGRSIAQTILDVAEVEKASMIVMTTHGRSGLGRVLLGSVAEAVVHAAPIPVLLVKGEQPVAAWGR